MIDSNWEVTLNWVVRENFPEEMTVKFNKYKSQVHGKIRIDSWKETQSNYGQGRGVRWRRNEMKKVAPSKVGLVG